MSAFAASYPRDASLTSTSGAAYISEPHLVCRRKDASSLTWCTIAASPKSAILT